MARQSKQKKDETKSSDMLITCKSGKQFIFRNVSKNSSDIVSGHALSRQPLTVEISDIEKVEWVVLEISKEKEVIYPPQNELDT